MDFDVNKLADYSKQELVQFWIELRDKKKEIEENIAIINATIVEMYWVEGKERYWDYNVFERQCVSYSVKKDYDYSQLHAERPDLFVPDKAKMWKEFPDAIDRKITNALEISKDKVLTTNKSQWD